MMTLKGGFMKKILCLFLLLAMFGCGKENNGGQEITEKNQIVAEKTENKVNNEKEKISETENNIFSVKNVFVNSNSKPRIEIEFSEDLDGENSIEAYIKIDTDIPYKVAKDKNKIVVNGDFKIGENYKVEIIKGLKGKSRKFLEENVVKEVVFREIEPKIMFSNDGIILPAGEKKIAFRSVNVKKVNLKVKKVYENNFTQFLQNFIFKGNGNIFDWNVENNFYQVGDTVFEESYNLDTEKNIWTQTEVELGNLINQKGLFIVELNFDENGIDYTFPPDVENWEKNNFIRNNGRIGKAILISDMGLIADAENKNVTVTAVDILKNEPMKNADIKIISLNNQVIAEGKTDAKGEFKFDKTDNMMYVLAEKNGEKSILKFTDALLSYDGFAVDGVYNSNGIKSFIYTERGIYRPGDEINVSFIVRNGKEKLPDNHPIIINVYSPTGKKFIEKQVIKDGKDGFYTYSFKTNLDSETGIWRVETQIGSEKFVKDISVETIVPYKIKVETVVPEKTDINQAQEIGMDIKSDYLFGAPASNLKYESELVIKEKVLNFEKFRNYTFKNPTTYSFNYRDYKNGVLDEEGKATVKFDLSKITPQNVNFVGMVTTKVIETSGRPVIDRNITELKKFDSYVGIKIPEDTYIKSGDKLNLETAVTSENGEDFVAGKKLVYRVYKNEYSWWWDYDSYNSFMKSIKTDRNTTLVYEKEFISSDKPYIIDYAVDGEGEIFVEVEDVETKQSTGINLYASTWQNSSVNKKVDKLKMETDEKKYSIGDTAKVIFEGTKGAKALITVEKSGEILSREWRNAEDLKNIYELKVTEEMFPNAYVKIGLYQDYEKIDNDRPLRLYGAVPVAVENNETKLDIKVETPKEIKPNEKFTVKVKNSAGEKMNYTVAVVDEGILDITGFATPKPWDYFYQKEAMQVCSYDNYSEVIGKIYGDVHQVLKTGGDGFINEMAMMKSAQRDKNMGIEDVQRFKPVAMFEGVLTTDEKGEGVVEFTMPNYMGAVKVMVVGAENEKYGSAESEILVKAPVVSEISLPRSLKVGDEFVVPVSVFALEDGEIKVEVDFMGEKQIQIVNLDKKGNKIIYFNEKVGNIIGNGKVKISVLSKEYDYHEEIDININSNNPYLYINEVKISEEGKEIVFTQPEDYIKGSVESAVTISNAPILAIDNRIKWLIRYPYGCAEQTVSAMFPQLYIDMLTESNKFDSEKIRGNINGGIQKLAKHQLYDGSFAYWQGGDTDVWATNYVGHFLIEAKAKGYYVPENMFDKWLAYEKKISRNNELALETKVYTLYLLALADAPQVSELNLVYENYFDKLSTTGKWRVAATYKLIGEDKLATEIAEKLSVVPDKAKDDEYYRYSYGSEFRDKAVILDSYYTVYGKPQGELYREILRKLQSDEWLSTQSVGYSLMTLAKITQEKGENEVSGTLVLDGKEIKFITEKGIFEYNIPAETKNIKIDSDNIIFVNYTWEGVPVNYERENISENFKLERHYYNMDGKEINPETLSSGESFWLEIKLLPSDNVNQYIYVNDVALTQILPSGWEIENIRATGGEYPQWIQERTANNYVEYEDIRDDRVMWFFDFNNYNNNGNSFFVKINAVTKGKFDFPGTKAEGMYNNSYQAYLKGFRVEVK